MSLENSLENLLTLNIFKIFLIFSCETHYIQRALQGQRKTMKRNEKQTDYKGLFKDENVYFHTFICICTSYTTSGHLRPVNVY